MSNSNFNNKLKNIMTYLMVIITIILVWQFIAIYSQETQEYNVTLIPTLPEIIKGIKEFSIFNYNSIKIN